MRVKTPTILQMESVECGATALAICMSHFGKYVSLEELRMHCGVMRDGSNVGNLIKTAEQYGFKSYGYTKDSIDDLFSIKLPFIAHWNFNHFVVVEGFNKKRIYINDPASGPRKITYQEFDESFTGIVVTVQPAEHFAKSGKKVRLWPLLKERLSAVKAPIAYISLVGLGLVVPGLMVPATTQLFYDQVINNLRLDFGLWIVSALGITALLVGILTWMQQRTLNHLNVYLTAQFQSSFLWHILRLPIHFYAQRFSGEVANRMNLNESVVNTLTDNLAIAFINIVLIFFYAWMIYFYSAAIALVGIITAVINLALLWMINRSRNDAYARVQQELGKSIGFSIGSLQSIESIKAAGNEQDVFSKWAGYFTKQLNAEREINVKDVILTAFPTFFQGLATAALLGIGSYEALHGRLTIGMLMALQGLLMAFLLPVSQMVNLGSQFQTMKINIARIDDVLKNKIDPLLINKKADTEDEIQLQGYLELKDVTFGYNPLDPPLIENLSFSLKPGERLALVGPSGSGKSTLAKLISGLYQPWKGEILYDGKPLNEIPHYQFQNSFGAVDQKIFLFAGSVEENLTLWDSTIPEQDIVTACKDANIHDVILNRLQGYEAYVIEGGTNFGGGERQRLEIARALVKNPRILVMDEATSSLDSQTEERISKNIRRRGCTCVMIAHRLSTIQECDEIIVLDKGKVVARGTHEELKQNSSLYLDLVTQEQCDG